MKRAWKCFNCGGMGGFDFEAEKPVCPNCKADGETPEGHHAVVPRVILHFIPPTLVRGKGTNRLACRPDVSIIGNTQGLRATGEADVVTCEACKKTDAFLKAKDRAVDLSNAVLDTPEAMAAVMVEPSADSTPGAKMPHRQIGN